jgi:hypothetical protein
MERWQDGKMEAEIRKEIRKEGKKERRKEGKKERRKEGKKERRKEEQRIDIACTRSASAAVLFAIADIVVELK